MKLRRVKQTQDTLEHFPIAQLLCAIRKQNAVYENVLAQMAAGRKDQSKEECKTKNRRKRLKFTDKEILVMPTTYRNIFAANNYIVHYRHRKDGVYEARFHRQGIDIEVSSKELKQLKEKFIEKLYLKANELMPTIAEKQCEKPVGKVEIPTKQKVFAEYADEWLRVKNATTKPTTYKEYARLIEHDILPAFGNRNPYQIERGELQKYLLGYAERGILRTAHKLWLILRCIFDIVAEDSGKPSPMEKVVVPNYETKKGSALTYDEEKTLVKYCVKNTGKDTSSALLVLLYTGLRRSELKTLEVIDGAWLECETSKERMGKNAVKRRIPFTPMLKRVLTYIDFEKAKNANLNSLSNAMKRVLPNHHLHELRYSFITRCKESGVHGEVVLLWDGHEEDRTLHSSKVDRGYTDFSKEFQLKEALKVDYLKWDS